MRKYIVFLWLTVFALLVGLSGCAQSQEVSTPTCCDEVTVSPPEESEAPEETTPLRGFCDYEWDEIILACQSNEIPDNWVVGETKSMTIDGVEYNIMIIGKNHDAYADGSGMAPLTFQLVECYQTLAQMYPTMSTDACWQECTMRTTTLPQTLDLMPVKDAIKEVNKVTRKKDNNGLEIVADRLFLLSVYEVYGDSVA